MFGTSQLVKDVTIPTGSSLEILDGGAKVVVRNWRCNSNRLFSSFIKLSGTLSIMEIHRSFNVLYRKPTSIIFHNFC
jgi:hypothetical protein